MSFKPIHQHKSQQPAQKSSNSTDPVKLIIQKLSQKIGSQNLAYLTMAMAAPIFALGFLYANQYNFDVCQTFLVRSIAVIILNFIIARVYGMDITFKDPYNFKILLIRNILATIQNIMYTLSQFYLAQPIVQTLNTSAIMFIFILDYFINSVTVTRKQLYGVVLGIIGVLLTVNGQFIITKINPSFKRQSQFQNYVSDDPKVKLMIALIFIGSNVLWAYAQVITKKMNGVNPVQLNLHLGIVYAIGAGLFYPSMVEKQVEVSNFLVGIIACGFVTAFSQILFIGALKMTKNTGVVTTFSFNSVIVGYLVSVIKYNQPLNPVCIIGAGFILIGLLRILLKEKKEEVPSIKQ